MLTRTAIETYKQSLSLTSTDDPQKEIERILTTVMSPDTLPAITDLSLYYIAGVGANRTTGVESVLYTPEFLYVADIGTNRLAGVSISFDVRDLGDPGFPDFSAHAIRSIESRNDRDLIFPAVAGELLFGVTPGTPEADVIKEVSKVARNVSRVTTDLYQADVVPFDEDSTATTIQSISFVRYAEMNHIVRIIDFKPGWRVKRVL